MVVTINLETLFWLAGGIGVTLALLAKIYKNLPSTKLEERVEKLEEKVDNDNQRIDTIKNQLTDMHSIYDEYVKMNSVQSNILIKGMLTITEINASVADKLGIDDSKEKLNKYREELNNYLLK